MANTTFEEIITINFDWADIEQEIIKLTPDNGIEKRIIINPSLTQLKLASIRVAFVLQLLDKYRENVFDLLRKSISKSLKKQIPFVKILSVHLDQIEQFDDTETTINDHESMINNNPDICRTMIISLDQGDDTYIQLKRIYTESLIMFAFMDGYRTDLLKFIRHFSGINNDSNNESNEESFDETEEETFSSITKINFDTPINLGHNFKKRDAHKMVDDVLNDYPDLIKEAEVSGEELTLDFLHQQLVKALSVQKELEGYITLINATIANLKN
jgi:hypothetical protein